MEIKNRNILITGANRGIGLAFAEACAREGAHLVLAVRKNDEELKKNLSNAGAASVLILEADLVTREGVEKLIQKISSLKVDILFNNAGLLTGGLIENQSADDIYNMFQVNLLSLVQLSRAVVPQMVERGSGKIINHSSVSAIMHFPSASTYAASKSAVWAFTDCLEQELKGTGVSTLCLFTPGIKTRMFDQIDVLMGQNISTPKDSITPETYALRIIKAVKNDAVYLKPTGVTGAGLFIAKHFTSLFNWVVSTQFRR